MPCLKERCKLRTPEISKTIKQTQIGFNCIIHVGKSAKNKKKEIGPLPQIPGKGTNNILVDFSKYG